MMKFRIVNPAIPKSEREMIELFIDHLFQTINEWSPKASRDVIVGLMWKAGMGDTHNWSEELKMAVGSLDRAFALENRRARVARWSVPVCGVLAACCIALLASPARHSSAFQN